MFFIKQINSFLLAFNLTQEGPQTIFLPAIKLRMSFLTKAGILKM